jgi:hypothetical protein
MNMLRDLWPTDKHTDPAPCEEASKDNQGGPGHAGNPQQAAPPEPGREDT